VWATILACRIRRLPTATVYPIEGAASRQTGFLAGHFTSASVEQLLKRHPDGRNVTRRYAQRLGRKSEDRNIKLA
jgi:hypothetical protein